MNKRHRNLTQPVQRFLINSLTTADFGVYTDSILSQKILMLKKAGISINHTNMESSKVCSADGQVKVMGFNLDTTCPCTECNTNYGIELVKRPYKPGVFNSLDKLSLKGYAGTIKKPLECVSGEIPTAIIVDAKDDLINQINGDLGFSDPYSGSAAIAGKMVMLDVWNAASTITINGVAYGAQATRAAFISAINAKTNAYAFAHPNDVNAMYLIANSAPTTLNVVATAGTIGVDTTYYVGLIGKWIDIPFEIKNADASDIQATLMTIQESVQPSLTPTEVFQEFANMGHHGNLALNIYRDLPVKDAHYCKYSFQFVSDADSLNSGASHGESFENTIEVYIKEDQLGTNIWDATDYMWESSHAGFGADRTFDQLLTYLFA